MFRDLTREEIEARISASHADIRSVYDYWKSKCGLRLMPKRTEIDPLEIWRFISSITILDVTTDTRRFVYRLSGAKDIAARGYDPTGKSVAEAFFGGTLEETLSCYQYVVDTRGPFCYRDPYLAPDGRTERDDILYLPLSDDAFTVNNILVFSHSYQRHKREIGPSY